MNKNIFDFLVVGVYILLVVTFGTLAALLVRESTRLKSVDRRVALITQVMLVMALGSALDSLYWSFAMSGRMGFLPLEVGRVMYQSKLAVIPKTCLLLSGFVLLLLLRKREIPELGRETEEGRRIRILHRITDSTTQSLDLREMLGAAIPRTLELIGMGYAAVYLRDEKRDGLKLVSTFGQALGPEAVEHLDPHSDAVADAAESNTPTLDAPQHVGRSGGRSSSAVYVPLLSREVNIGVLVLRSRTPKVFSPRDMDMLVSVGNQLASAIENAVLFKQNEMLLAETTQSADGLAKTVEERTRMLQVAQEQLGLAEAHKRQFYKDTVMAVTSGKLVIVEPEELPETGWQPIEICELSHKEDIGRVRKVIREIASDAGMCESRIDDMLLCAGEAMTNAIKHGEYGIVRIYACNETLSLAVEDHGPGIDALTLPKATLLRGYSTKPSLGMGYALILDLADKVYLCTGPTGTIVIIEMTIKKPSDELTIDIIPDTWGQFEGF